MTKPTYIFIILCLVALSCGSTNISVEGLDLSRWKSDNGECREYRSSTKELLDSNRKNLLSFSEKTIIQNLGFPDKAELIDHSEKFYFYKLVGEDSCNSNSKNADINLRIRFNSVGYSKEVLILKSNF